MGIKPTKRVGFKGTWDEKSNAERRRARRRNMMLKEILGEGSKNVSNADRRRAEELFGDRWAPIRQSGGTISDADFLNRNDGGMAKKTRTF